MKQERRDADIVSSLTRTMLRGELPIAYWDWLVHRVENGDRYRHLLRILHEREFVWFVDMDDNWIGHGEYQRQWFQEEYPQWDHLELDRLLPFVSVLEVMIALARKMEWIQHEPVGHKRFFLMLLENIGLLDCTGQLSQAKQDRVTEALETVLFRTYNHDGSGGGFFPLARPKEDQRKLNLWMQMNAWAIERHWPNE